MDMDVRPELWRVERPPQSGQDRPRRQPQGGRGQGNDNGGPQAADGIGGGGSLPPSGAAASPPPLDSVSISAAARVVAETGYALTHPPLSIPRLLLNTLLRRR